MKEIIFPQLYSVNLPEPNGLPIIEPCKVVTTKDSKGKANGMVLEVAKYYKDILSNPIVGDRTIETTVYITTVASYAMKGYHGHILRTSTYSLISGEAEVHILNLYTGELLVYQMNADEVPYRVITEPGYFLALKNRNSRIAIFVGVPNPPYNPNVREQLELDPQLVETALRDNQIKQTTFSCTRNGIVMLSNSYDQ